MIFDIFYQRISFIILFACRRRKLAGTPADQVIVSTCYNMVAGENTCCNFFPKQRKTVKVRLHK